MALKKEELKHGTYYYGHCRNTLVARWVADLHVFRHWRRKFDHVFTEEIRCPEDDGVFDVFVAKREATPEEIQEHLALADGKEVRI